MLGRGRRACCLACLVAFAGRDPQHGRRVPERIAWSVLSLRSASHGHPFQDGFYAGDLIETKLRFQTEALPDARLDVRPKTLLPRLAPLLPASHSPIQPQSGNGNQKAYLAEVSQAVVDLVLEAAGLPAADLLATPPLTAVDFATTLDDLVEADIRHDRSLDDTVREQLVRARRARGCSEAGSSAPNRCAASPGSRRPRCSSPAMLSRGAPAGRRRSASTGPTGS